MADLPTPKMSELLQAEFMRPLNLSVDDLAKLSHVPTSCIQDLLHDQRQVSVDMSVRLGRFFGVADDYLLRLQTDIDLRNAERGGHAGF